MSVPKRGHTTASLEKALRPLVRQMLQKTTITWMPDNAGQTHLLTKETELNPIHGGLLSTMVHEALHQLLTPAKSPFLSDALHELIILKFEDELTAYINRTPSAQSFWYPRCLSLMESK